MKKISRTISKAICVLSIICISLCSVSFRLSGSASAAETINETPIKVVEVVAEPKQNLALRETVAIPEIDFSELKAYEVEVLIEEPEEPSEEETETLTLEYVKEHIYDYYTREEVRQTALIVQAEDLIAQSDTIWSAHVWVILGRVGATGFAGNDSIIGILSAKGQFSTYTVANLSKEVDPRVEAIVVDVFARKVLEDLGAPEWEVGRTVPKTHLFFDNRDGDFYNEFYRGCWYDRYDPFSAPYNPYSN